MHSSYLKSIGVTVGVIATIAGGAWAAKGYVDTEARVHSHLGYVERDEMREINKKLDEIRDRLARIEGRLEK